MNRSRGKILVIRGGAIGDFILTLPVLAALRERFPETRLEVLGYPHIVSLAVLAGLADHVRSIEARALAGFFARGGELDPELSGYFGGFSVIVSYLYDPDAIFRTNVAACSRAQFIVGPHRPDECMALHATEVFLKPLERLAIFAPDPVPRIRFEPETDSDQSKGQWLAVHPGSGSERKNWPEAKWLELLKRVLVENPLNLLLVGGESEGDRLQRLASALSPERVRLAANLPLTQLAERLRSCSGYLGHDSGISHLAAALGLPGLILWGESIESIWRPKSERFRVLRGQNGLESLAVEEVLLTLGSAGGLHGTPA